MCELIKKSKVHPSDEGKGKIKKEKRKKGRTCDCIMEVDGGAGREASGVAVQRYRGAAGSLGREREREEQGERRETFSTFFFFVGLLETTP